MRIANIDREILHIFVHTMNKLRNFNEIFTKDVTYGNIKSHKNLGFHHLFRIYVSIFFRVS